MKRYAAMKPTKPGLEETQETGVHKPTIFSTFMSLIYLLIHNFASDKSDPTHALWLSNCLIQSRGDRHV